MTMRDEQLRSFAEDPVAHVAPGPDEERIDHPRYVIAFSPGIHSWSVLVCRARFLAGTVDADVAQIRASIRDRGRRAATWTVGDSSTPEGLVERLTGLGLKVEGRSDVLVLTRPPDRGSSPAFEVRAVRTLDDLLAAIDVAVEAFGWPVEDAEDERARAAETLDAGRGGTTSRLLAFDAGRPVATGQAWWSPRGLYLGGGATLPSDRGRGAMTSLVAAAWEQAVRRGAPALVTYGGELSSPILLGLGFEKVGEVVHLVDDVVPPEDAPDGPAPTMGSS